MSGGDSSGVPSLPSRCTDRTVAVVDGVVDGRCRSVGRCRRSHGSSIRRYGRNFLPIYKWGFSEPCFGQRPGETWCVRKTWFRSGSAVQLPPTGRSARVSTGDEVVAPEPVGLMSTSCRHGPPVRRPIIFRTATCAGSGPGGPPPALVASRVVGADRSTLSTDGDSSLRGCRPATS